MSAVLDQVLQWTMALSYYFHSICKYTQSPVKPRLAVVKYQKHDVFTEYNLLKIGIFLTATFSGI